MDSDINESSKNKNQLIKNLTKKLNHYLSEIYKNFVLEKNSKN